MSPGLPRRVRVVGDGCIDESAVGNRPGGGVFYATAGLKGLGLAPEPCGTAPSLVIETLAQQDIAVDGLVAQEDPIRFRSRTVGGRRTLRTRAPTCPWPAVSKDPSLPTLFTPLLRVPNLPHLAPDVLDLQGLARRVGAPNRDGWCDVEASAPEQAPTTGILRASMEDIGAERPLPALRTLSELAPEAAGWVITGGDRGAWSRTPGGTTWHARVPMIDVDATGAGDVFVAGLFAAHVRGMDVEDGMRVGVGAAAGFLQARLKQGPEATLFPDWETADQVAVGLEPVS